ncbi:hypothetical protein D8M33_00765 [Micrococcus sp. HSID17245]|uniref:Z1 domain-containing protein n=1 Tax=Micrococcus sp. HSID17245 TaxID=2419508 RepID=UPI000F8649EA|nr:Z1 domain-containing protein [Micrococcus sp. HSID17245]RUQ34418.1 hypothetical protein D8M33_00765 [Micrococcus sp. HSID17245]
MNEELAQQRKFIEQLLDKKLDDELAPQLAVSRLREELPSGMHPALDDIVAERQERNAEWAQIVRVVEGGGSTAESDPGRNWYYPPKGGGLRWTRLKERMASGGLADAVDSIDRSTNSTVKELAQPFTSERRRGIVIGNVQSGKTANYAALASKALDAGYKFVLVLSGIHNNLRTQTQERLNRDLGVEAYSDEWGTLTTPQHDLSQAEVKNARFSVSGLSGKRKMIAVMKKNSSRLDHLLEFFDQLDERTLMDTPILIIDDESDQATPDSSRAKKDVETDPTVINKKMRQVWAKVKNGTYVGYTATPFANVFMDPKPHGTDELESLYPRDFIHVMPTPKNYFGAERLFGIDEGVIDAEGSEGLDVVRSIPEHELPMLAPTKSSDVDSFVPQVTDSLEDAIRWFVVASAIRRLRGQTGKHSSMLVHTTHRTKPHQAMRDEIVDFLAPLKEEARNGEVESFHAIFNKEEGRVASLYTGSASAPTWPALQEEIVNVLRLLEVVVDNGEEEPEDRIVYSDDRPRTAVVIGGGTLSRGLTLEGLFVSYFTRTSNAYDTLLQMGRWFGYRPGYEDLQRIWLAEGLETDYQFLATVESEMRAEIRRLTSEGLTPEKIGLRIRRHPGRLQITSATKMKHAQHVEFTFQGYRTQTAIFDFSDPNVQEANTATAVSLLRSLETHRAATEGTRQNSHLYTGVPFTSIKAFFDAFTVHERYKETHRRAIEWVDAKLPDVPWRVVLTGGTKEPAFTKETFTVNSVNRAPLRPLEEKSINIRALMRGGDRVADLVLEGNDEAKGLNTDVDRMALRLRPEPEGGAGGQGLLVLYPISLNSTPQNQGGPTTSDRAEMQEVLTALGLEALCESDMPLMGYGVVLPSDVEGRLEADGDFMSVVIEATSEEDADAE